MPKFICILDFMGNKTFCNGKILHQASYWADYNTDTKQTDFGGIFLGIPPLLTDDCPTDDACWEHIYNFCDNDENKLYDICQKNYYAIEPATS